MADSYDAVIIGAGVIGASVGLELARRGRRTLNIDALPAAGYGSTSASAAIDPRLLFDAPRHGPGLRGLPLLAALGRASGPAGRYRPGPVSRDRSVVIKTDDNQNLAPGLCHDDRARHPVRGLGRRAAAPRAALLRPRRYDPPRRPDDPAFGDGAGELAGAICSRPAAM